ncbi:hypothetical protein DFJ63DRAFT_315986 [Scheffersomyces coipomensis]|uniref:uncharacterized protein n=1 Tax=Scheffersomyces coipomensis TaxID=1788519 RepID=UPI00315D11FE
MSFYVSNNNIIHTDNIDQSLTKLPSSSTITSDPKRRKLNHPIPIHFKMNSNYPSTTIINNTIINNKTGTITPVFNEEQDVVMIEDSKSDSKDCPCGYLHGPGQGHDHDINAVGFSSYPLLKGPE